MYPPPQMPNGKNRFISLCQQLLVLATVAAVLLPAASVVRVDVLREGTPATAPVASSGSTETAEVETASVEPTVTEIPLRPANVAAPGSKSAAGGVLGRGSVVPSTSGKAASAAHAVVSQPQSITGYGTVGVTWSNRVHLAEGSITVQARTQTAGRWSGWTTLEYHDEHGPDPDSAEAAHSRPGTDPLLVGDVEQVQVRASTGSRALPPELSLAVIEPGQSKGTASERPAIDTGALPDAGASADTGSTELRSGAITPKPQIYSRAQWGADESMRDASALHYYEVHAGFVHHTVNANDYTRAEVPGIIRSIYAYHTRSRGWSDIGYNYLIDRFGRIWEGRYGGVDRPVVGAHTLNYNDYAFAASAIGNFELTEPTSAMTDAFSRLFAWKLALHGVNAASTSQVVGSGTFQAINGHRDAARTACPGKYLYAKIPTIRAGAAALQGWTGRDLDRDLGDGPYPDLVARRASDKRIVVVPTGGGLSMTKGAFVGSGWGGYDLVIGTPDLTGDRRADVVSRTSSGLTRVHPGNGSGGFGSGRSLKNALAGLRAVTAAGDLDADGRNDLAGIRVSDGRLVVLMGRADHGLTRRVLGTSLANYDLLAGVGDVTGDRRGDLVARSTAGKLVLFAARRLGSPRTLTGNWSGIETMTGIGDYTRDGRPDLLVRSRKGKGFVLPGTAAGSFGRLIGPFSRLKGFDSFSGAGQIDGAATPDLVGRVGDRLVVVRSRGTVPTLPERSTGIDGSGLNTLLNVGDWDRDGYGDLITRTTSGVLQLRLGNGGGRFQAPRTLSSAFSGVTLLAAVGDVTGDGFPDLMGQPRGSGMRLYAGRGAAGLAAGVIAATSITASRQLGAGRWDSDGAPDSLFVVGSRLYLRRGNGPGGLTGVPVPLSLDLSRFNWVGTSNQLNGQHRTILLVRERATGELRSIRAVGNRFGPARLLATGFDAYDLIG
ncbi:MAG: FG-GAP-like repeat-containing protein [Nocardioides sp.]